MHRVVVDAEGDFSAAVSAISRFCGVCFELLGVDEKTGEITAQVLTDNKTDDAAVLVDLVADTFDQGADISKVGTDGAYDHYDCWNLLAELQIKPIIPPRENAFDLFWHKLIMQIKKPPKPRISSTDEMPRFRKLEMGGVEAPPCLLIAISE